MGKRGSGSYDYSAERRQADYHRLLGEWSVKRRAAERRISTLSSELAKMNRERPLEIIRRPGLDRAKPDIAAVLREMTDKKRANLQRELESAELQRDACDHQIAMIERFGV